MKAASSYEEMEAKFEGVEFRSVLTPEQIAELRCEPGEIRPMYIGLQWTQERPTTPGWYWYCDEHASAHIVRVYGEWTPYQDGRLDVWVRNEQESDANIADYEGAWAGPLEPPVPEERWSAVSMYPQGSAMYYHDGGRVCILQEGYRWSALPCGGFIIEKREG